MAGAIVWSAHHKIEAMSWGSIANGAGSGVAYHDGSMRTVRRKGVRL